MDQETLKQKLSDGFNFTVFQRNLIGGYELEMKVVSIPCSLGAESYRVFLCGTDPLTGQEVRCGTLSWGFDFAHKSRTSAVLSYDGQFELQCEAVMENGERIPFKSYPITLVCERNAPKVSYSLKHEGSFTRLTLQSNCRGTAPRFLWLGYEGQRQRMEIPTVDQCRVCYYLPTTGDITLASTDASIRINQER